ncbi:MAG: tRNA uridine-5-carboxymethylaminomethyl(34) synthesis GTPase MnmE, partial [Lachnospiraceae bacterium]|nr:tRNA uridine-5-carboxymethylaminomethyl(34) synthesis GTPase MnmE [Lachnospiraceae bacterium]
MSFRENEETIAAIATGMTDAGIGIVRISGEKAIAVGESVFCSKSNKKLSEQKSHTMHFGMIYDGNEMIDEALVSLMRAPHSYTGEDTVEINCHGGIYVTNRILQTVLSHGARLAEPGEFTKRAFLNGKIDLSRAEAVMDLIQSKNEFALKNSLSQLHGSLYNTIKKLREDIIYEIAFIESALDDPEHISLDGYPEKLEGKIEEILDQTERLRNSFQNGRIRKEGIRTVIIGKPNAGKSSLLNILSCEERAIVTQMAGTTRDILEESVKIGDMVLNLVDTAGIREASDEVEQIGISRAKKYAMDADLILYVADSSLPLDENDDEIISLIQEKNVIVLLNKSDLATVTGKEDLLNRWNKFGGQNDLCIIDTCTKAFQENDHKWKSELVEELHHLFFHGNISINDELVITNVRHLQELTECEKSLNLVKESIQNGMPEDFLSIDLTDAYVHLGNIIGEEISDDLM